MTNSTLLTIFSIVFILLGAYNLYTASKKAREMRLAGQQFRWTRQINALVGIEYLLLAWVFLLSNLYRNGSIPPSIRSIVLPLYFVALIAAALFAGLVIFRGIRNARAIRAQRAASTTTNAMRNGASPTANAASTRTMTARERKRERRKNAAAARRRRAGKA
jgi:hypothetical protein